MSSKLIGIQEAADLLSVDPRTIRRRIADGTLSAVRIGPRLIRLRVAEVEALLEPIPTVEPRRQSARAEVPDAATA